MAPPHSGNTSRIQPIPVNTSTPSPPDITSPKNHKTEAQFVATSHPRVAPRTDGTEAHRVRDRSPLADIGIGIVVSWIQTVHKRRHLTRTSHLPGYYVKKRRIYEHVLRRHQTLTFPSNPPSTFHHPSSFRIYSGDRTARANIPSVRTWSRQSPDVTHVSSAPRSFIHEILPHPNKLTNTATPPSPSPTTTPNGAPSSIACGAIVELPSWHAPASDHEDHR